MHREPKSPRLLGMPGAHMPSFSAHAHHPPVWETATGTACCKAGSLRPLLNDGSLKQTVVLILKTMDGPFPPQKKRVGFPNTWRNTHGAPDGAAAPGGVTFFQIADEIYSCFQNQ